MTESAKTEINPQVICASMAAVGAILSAVATKRMMDDAELASCAQTVLDVLAKRGLLPADDTA